MSRLENMKPVCFQEISYKCTGHTIKLETIHVHRKRGIHSPTKNINVESRTPSIKTQCPTEPNFVTQFPYFFVSNGKPIDNYTKNGGFVTEGKWQNTRFQAAASGAVKPRPAVGVTNIPNHDARPEPAPGYTDVCTHLYCSDRSKYSPVDDTG